jgi:hypothetical protein
MRETPITEIYEKYVNVKAEIESIYTNYLDTNITDADFAKSSSQSFFKNLVRYMRSLDRTPTP